VSLFQKIAFFLLLATIPIQLGKHFWPDFSFVQGIRIDYLSPTFYLSDLSFLFLFFCSYNSVLKRFFKILYSRAGALLVICLVLSTIFSANWLAAFYGIVKLFEFFYIGVFVSMFFKKRGFDSIITDNGDKVFETLASENVGVILMDINLSNTYFNGEKIDGIKLSQLIKANTDYNNIPLVLVTASSLSSQIKKFLTDTKAEDIVTKPILDYNRFVNKINYYIAS